jgi:hypothetical protein
MYYYKMIIIAYFYQNYIHKNDELNPIIKVKILIFAEKHILYYKTIFNIKNLILIFN